jgi:hypothetical protein
MLAAMTEADGTHTVDVMSSTSNTQMTSGVDPMNVAGSTPLLLSQQWQHVQSSQTLPRQVAGQTSDIGPITHMSELKRQIELPQQPLKQMSELKKQIELPQQHLKQAEHLEELKQPRWSQQQQQQQQQDKLSQYAALQKSKQQQASQPQEVQDQLEGEDPKKVSNAPDQRHSQLQQPQQMPKQQQEGQQLQMTAQKNQRQEAKARNVQLQQTQRQTQQQKPYEQPHKVDQQHARSKRAQPVPAANPRKKASKRRAGEHEHLSHMFQCFTGQVDEIMMHWYSIMQPAVMIRRQSCK